MGETRQRKMGAVEAETLRLTGVHVDGSVQNQVLALTSVYGCPFSFRIPFG